MFETLETAIRLRETGNYEEARQILLDLLKSYPDDPQINYQCAWVHDALGLEKEAVPFYEKAIALGLSEEDLPGAMLGLGSTYRCLGDYQKSADLLSRASQLYPDRREFEVFLAMALYNLGDSRKAMELLLKNLAETSQDLGLNRYKRALLFYAGRLDETWG
jgi:tetratricopeptide (TPR) repeat protein